jgi:hypothetical protein
MSQLRTVAKLERFSPDEITRVSERARTCGRTAARYIREAALGAVPKARHHIERDALLGELARTGRDLARVVQLVESAPVEGFGESHQELLIATVAEYRAALRAVIGATAKDARAA